MGPQPAQARPRVSLPSRRTSSVYSRRSIARASRRSRQRSFRTWGVSASDTRKSSTSVIPQSRLKLLGSSARQTTDSSGLPLIGLRKVPIGQQKPRRKTQNRRDNAVYTSSRTYWNFLPRSLYDNTYEVPIAWHLIFGVINFFLPAPVQLSVWYASGPVFIVLGYRILLDFARMVRDHSHDRVQNRRKVWHLNPRSQSFQEIEWEQLRVGDIIRLEEGSEVPADMLLLSTSDSTGVVHTDLAGWVGSAELQYKVAVEKTRLKNEADGLKTLDGHVICSHPDPRACLSRRKMESFSGSIKLRELPRAYDIGPQNILIRGSRVNGARFVNGLVVFVGRDCLMQRWKSESNDKRGFLAEMGNRHSVAMLVVQFISVMIDLMVGGIRRSGSSFWSTLEMQSPWARASVAAAVSLIKFLHLVPLALIPTMDLSRWIQASKIRRDDRLGSQSLRTGNWRPAQVGRAAVIETLGSIDLAMFDKTGTLTTGELNFVGCSVGLQDYGHVRETADPQGGSVSDHGFSTPGETDKEDSEAPASSAGGSLDQNRFLSPRRFTAFDLNSHRSDASSGQENSDEPVQKRPSREESGFRSRKSTKGDFTGRGDRTGRKRTDVRFDESIARRRTNRIMEVLHSSTIPGNDQVSPTPGHNPSPPNMSGQPAKMRSLDLREVFPGSTRQAIARDPSFGTDVECPRQRGKGPVIIRNSRSRRRPGWRRRKLVRIRRPPRPFDLLSEASGQDDEPDNFPEENGTSSPPSEISPMPLIPALPLNPRTPSQSPSVNFDSQNLPKTDYDQPKIAVEKRPKVPALRSFNLPTQCPGLLDLHYVTPSLSLPLTFRTDLDADLVERSKTFDDRRIFEDLRSGERRQKASLHFIRALALCNEASPVFVCEETPPGVTWADVMHATGAGPRDQRSSAATLADEQLRHGNRAHSRSPGMVPVLNLDALEDQMDPALAMMSPRRREKRQQITTAFNTVKQKANISGSRKDNIPPYLSHLMWEVHEKGRKKATYAPQREARHEIWSPENIKYLKLRGRKKEDICCACTAARMGFALISRTDEYADLDINGQLRRFELLGPTTSDARVTTMVCRQEDEHVATLYAAGLDRGVIDISDLRPRQKRELRRRLKALSSEGYRTLLIGYRQLNRTESRNFRKACADHKSAITKKNDRFEKFKNKLHSKLKILGVVLLQDELAPGASLASTVLRQAGCALWVVSGDRAEFVKQAAITAGFIARNTYFFDAAENWRRIHMKRMKSSMQQRRSNSKDGSSGAVSEDGQLSRKSSGAKLEKEAGGEARRELLQLFSRFRRARAKSQARGLELCTLFSTKVVSTLLSNIEMQTVFILMGCESDSVISYRLAAAQKGILCTTVSRCLAPQPVIMAVGDGIGDSSMLRAANVGVALFGQWNEEAVVKSDYAQQELLHASDVAVSNLEALVTLLCSHGAEALDRNARTILWTVYKSCVVGWPMLWYSWFGMTSLAALLGNEVMIPIILLAWTLIPPLAYHIYPSPEVSPNPQYVATVYAASRARWQTQLPTLYITLVEGLLLSLAAFFLLGYLGNRFGIMPSGKVANAMPDSMPPTLATIVCIRLFVQETFRPVAPYLQVQVASALAAAPLVIGLIIYWALIPDGIRYLRMPYIVLTCGALVFLTILLQLGITLYLHFFKPMELTHSKLSRYSREATWAMSVEGVTRIEDMAPIPITNFARESIVFSLVHRLVPYTVSLFNTGQLGRPRQNLGSSGGGEQPTLPSTSTLASGVSQYNVSPTHDLPLENGAEPISQETVIDDVVSVASLEALGSEKGVSSDLFVLDSWEDASPGDSSGSEDAADDAASEVGSLSYSSGEFDQLDSDQGSRPNSLRLSPPGGGSREMAPDASQIVMDNTRGRETIEHSDSRTRSLINTRLMTFKDQQLEEEYRASNAAERRQFANCYRCFFVGCIATGLLEVVAARHIDIHPALAIGLPIARNLIPMLFFVTSWTYWPWRHFDWLNWSYCLLYIATYLPSHVSDAPAVYSTAQFSVWTLVVSRTPVSQAILLNVLNLIASLVIDVTQLSISAVIFSITFSLGMVAFCGFAGHRLEFALRRRFMLNHQVDAARRKQRELLKQMLPGFVVEKMLSSPLNQDGIPEGLQAEDPGIVTVIFCDIYEFQNLVSALKPETLVTLLDALFLEFDKCAIRYQVTKIETVFETYLSCSGIKPGSYEQSRDRKGDVIRAMEMALRMLNVVGQARYVKNADTVQANGLAKGTLSTKYPTGPRSKPVASDTSESDAEETAQTMRTESHRLRVKIGMHTGKVTSGVVGAKKPQYALFGDTVNTASRMKMTGEADHIHVSGDTWSYIADDDRLGWQSRQLEVKGKGIMTTYLLTAVENEDYPDYALVRETALTARSISLESDDEHTIRSHPSVSIGFRGGARHQATRPEVIETPPIVKQRSMESWLSLTPPHSLRPSMEKFNTLFTMVKRSPATVPKHLRPVFSPSTLHGSAFGSPSGIKSSRVSHTSNATVFDLRGGNSQEMVTSQDMLRTGSDTLQESHRMDMEVTLDELTEEERQKSATIALNMAKFTENLSFFNLSFKKKILESRFVRSSRREWVYLIGVQFSLIIFMLVIGVTTVARIYSERADDWNAEIKQLFTPFASQSEASHSPSDRARASDYLTPSSDSSLMLGYWWIRASELVLGFATWLLFHELQSRHTRSIVKPSLAIQMASFLYIGVMIVFVLTPSWEHAKTPTQQVSWQYFSDTIEMAFVFVVLHHNSGLLFHHLILIDILMLTIITVFLTVVVTPNADSQRLLPLFPPMFFFQFLSCYVNELFNRFTWFVTQQSHITESRADELLGEMVPRLILEDFQNDRVKEAYHHRNMTFLFADIVGFTSYAKTIDATEVVRLLQKLFARFDRDSTKFHLFKLCTIGDAYVAVSDPSTETREVDPVPGADRCWRMAQTMLYNIRVVANEVNVPSLNMRIGLHFGECVGGIIGSGTIRYDLWGTDVLTGNSMESGGAPGRVSCSQSFKTFVENAFPDRFEFAFNKVVRVLSVDVPSYFVAERVGLNPSEEDFKARVGVPRGRRIARRRPSVLPPRKTTPGQRTVHDGPPPEDLERLRRQVDW